MIVKVRGFIPEFYQGTTVKFTLAFNYAGVIPDISSDTVTLFIKEHIDDLDAAALLDFDADVATQGAVGIARFVLTPTDTDIAPGRYVCEVVWAQAGGEEHIVYKPTTIQVRERVSDTA